MIARYIPKTPIKLTILDLFPDQIEIVGPARFVPRTPCWKWLGVKKNKYGSLHYEGRGWGAHQFSLYLKIGQRSDNTYFACHTCDNTWCVNPEHLFLGNHLTNQQDRIKWKVQITEEDIEFIRYSDLPSRILAKKFQLSIVMIERIRPMRFYAERVKYQGKLMNTQRSRRTSNVVSRVRYLSTVERMARLELRKKEL